MVSVEPGVFDSFLKQTNVSLDLGWTFSGIFFRMSLKMGIHPSRFFCHFLVKFFPVAFLEILSHFASFGHVQEFFQDVRRNCVQPGPNGPKRLSIFTPPQLRLSAKPNFRLLGRGSCSTSFGSLGSWQLGLPAKIKPR